MCFFSSDLTLTPVSILGAQWMEYFTSVVLNSGFVDLNAQFYFYL